MKSRCDHNRQFSTFRRVAVNTLKTEFLWFSISKVWMVSFSPVVPQKQHCSASERPWEGVLGKFISTTQRLGSVTHRQPRSSGQDSARSCYTQCRARPEPKILPSAVGLGTFAVLCSALQLWEGPCCGAEHGMTLGSPSG